MDRETDCQNFGCLPWTKLRRRARSGLVEKPAPATRKQPNRDPPQQINLPPPRPAAIRLAYLRPSYQIRVFSRLRSERPPLMNTRASIHSISHCV